LPWWAPRKEESSFFEKKEAKKLYMFRLALSDTAYAKG
jgi:hypothetical protein